MAALSNPAALANRCTATSTRSGEQCKRPAIKGGTVCRTHGGASPQVIKKAKERLMEMVDPALTELDRMLRAPGTSDGDRTRIALAILDRTGYGKSMTIEHELKPWEIMMEHVFVEARGIGMIRQPSEEQLAELDAEIVIPETEATFVDPDDDDSPVAEVTRIHPAYDPGTPDSTRPR